jgi:hypothetical protein
VVVLPHVILLPVASRRMLPRERSRGGSGASSPPREDPQGSGWRGAWGEAGRLCSQDIGDGCGGGHCAYREYEAAIGMCSRRTAQHAGKPIQTGESSHDSSPYLLGL